MFLLLWGFAFLVKSVIFFLGKTFASNRFRRSNKFDVYLYGVVVTSIIGQLILMNIPKRIFSKEYGVYEVTIRYEMYSLSILGLLTVIALLLFSQNKNERTYSFLVASLFAFPVSTLYLFIYFMVSAF
jgi:hypothetical protein